MTIEFKIANLDRDTADGFVTAAHWIASKTSGEFSAGSYGSVGFNKEDGVNLIPYADLTEATVISRVKNALGTEAVATIDAALTANIQDQKAPKTATGKPWSN